MDKFKKPCYMKNTKNWPCDYKASHNAFITAKKFCQWLLFMERRRACKYRNIFLLLVQCAAHYHKGLQLKHIQVLYLLPNITSYMHPLDHSIIHCVKHENWSTQSVITCGK
jgi:hypothetical protein